MLKIFQLIQKPQLRGAEIFAAQLSTHLVALGHECTLMTLFEGGATLPFTGPTIHLNRPIKKRLFDITGWKQLASWIEKEKPDIIQANAGDTLKFAVSSKLIFGWKTPIVFRNANKMSDFISGRLSFGYNQFLLNRVTQVISVSENCGKDLVNFFSMPVSKMNTVEIGIEIQPIGKLSEDVIPIFNKGPVLINVASMVPEKNQRGLLRIFKNLVEAIPSVQLVIVGSGKLENDLKEYARQLEIEAQVHFLGNRNDVLGMMKHSQALLLPSIIEGLPGVILEAMYAGCPVVAYPVGGIPEVIVHRQTGLMTKTNDEVEFAELVTSLLANRSLWVSVSEAAQRFVTVKFDNRNIVARFLAIYNRLLKPLD